MILFADGDAIAGVPQRKVNMAIDKQELIDLIDRADSFAPVTTPTAAPGDTIASVKKEANDAIAAARQAIEGSTNRTDWYAPQFLPIGSASLKISDGSLQ